MGNVAQHGVDRLRLGDERLRLGDDRLPLGFERGDDGLERGTHGLDRGTHGLDRRTHGLDRGSEMSGRIGAMSGFVTGSPRCIPRNTPRAIRQTRGGIHPIPCITRQSWSGTRQCPSGFPPSSLRSRESPVEP